MRQSKARIIADGIVAGLIGGAVIALWFLVFDAARGHPLETPALLAAALQHGAREPVALTGTAWLLVGEYTIAHFTAFAIIGLIGALLIDASERHSELFGILLVFTIGFEVFFIALIMLLGPAAAAALPWWKIIIGNLLGAIIFNGMAQPSTFAVTAALVLGYTALHFFAFAMFGIASSITMVASEYEPLLALGVFTLFLWFELCFVAFVTFLDQSAVNEIGWWNIIGGNVAALAAIVGYFEHGHPRVVPRLAERWKDEAAAEANEPSRGRRPVVRGL
jgi:hypothetical protein